MQINPRDTSKTKHGAVHESYMCPISKEILETFVEMFNDGKCVFIEIHKFQFDKKRIFLVRD